ncbi:MAG: hypothetical protein ACOC57_01065 [Acidobacteriota bacterium]
MQTNATVAHWVVLSTQLLREDIHRKKVIMTDHDFPSILYAVAKIAEWKGWKIETAGGLPDLEKSVIFAPFNHLLRTIMNLIW